MSFLAKALLCAVKSTNCFSRIQPFSLCSALKMQDLTGHRKGTPSLTDGAEGEKLYHFKGGKVLDAVLPTIETLNEVYDGTPYNQLPYISIKCSKNNTRIFVYDTNSKVLMSTSSKIEGFKHCKKKSTVAGQATGVAGGLKALRRGFKTVRVVIRGMGPGRMTAVKGLAMAGVNVVSITDFTRLPEIGPMPRRRRHI